MRVLLLVLALLVFGCDDTLELAVDLRTDMVSGVEFVGVRTTIAGSPIDRNASRGDDFLSGIRVAERDGLSPGDYGVTVALLDLDGRTVVERNVQLDLRESFGLTVVVTRSCLSIECPAVGGDPALTTCFAGTCVDPHCGAEGSACPPAQCSMDADCEAAGPCARGVCDEGACLSVGDDSMCGAAEYCDPDVGCVPLPGADAGPVDASMDAPVDAVPDGEPLDTGDPPTDAMPDGTTPRRIVRQLALGDDHACGLSAEGAVYCWGENELGQVGSTFLGEDLARPFALTALGVDNLAVVTGGQFSCVLRPMGAVACWGRGSEGELGDLGITTGSATPMPIPGVIASRLFAGGRHACTLDDAGDATCWGANDAGQLGRGTMTPAELPGPVTFSGSWTSLAVGNRHTCGVGNSGNVYCWGDDASGQIGPMASTALPAVLSGIPTSPEWRVFAGYDRSCATRGGAMPLCWGDNTTGALGLGDFVDHPTPVAISAEVNVVELAPGAAHTCTRNTGGTVRCAGSGLNGQLGNGTSPDTRASFAGITPAGEWNHVASGESFSCALDLGGAIYCWGMNTSGQLGNGTIEETNVPTPVVFP